MLKSFLKTPFRVFSLALSSDRWAATEGGSSGSGDGRGDVEGGGLEPLRLPAAQQPTRLNIRTLAPNETLTRQCRLTCALVRPVVKVTVSTVVGVGGFGRRFSVGCQASARGVGSHVARLGGIF